MPNYGERVDGHCSKCGGEWPEGEGVWPFCGRGGHGVSVVSYDFKAGFDDGLGEYVTSLGQRKQIMREHKLEYRDHPPKGQISARLDKIHEQQRERARG